MTTIYTGCFHVAKAAPGRISIARRAPKGMEALPSFPQLAPGPWFNSVPEQEYRRRFFGEILAPLSPLEVVRDLTALAEDRYGPGTVPILLCWERLAETRPAGEFCHRQMVSEWLRTALGVETVEVRAWPLRAAVAEPTLF